MFLRRHLLIAIILLARSCIFGLDQRFAIDTNKPQYLENAVPCLDSSIRYRKRPSSSVEVRSQLSIISLHDLSAVHMALTADVYLTQSWRDSRCLFKPLPGQGSVLTLYRSQGGEMSHPGLANLWQPDTHVLNAKSSNRPETVTKIRSQGLVSSRTRIACIISCPMDLHLFPMDRQMCSLVIQSSAHPKTELTYSWKDGNRTKLNFVQGLEFQSRMTPDIRLLGYRFRSSVSIPSEDGDAQVYDQIVVDIFLERPLGYFLWEVYMPATFIVVISFTSFWLDRAATPARVSLGVTTVLTITTLLSSANVNLPPTAYPKAIGIFLAGCFVFTFLAFLEFSAASFLERRRSLLLRGGKMSVCSENPASLMADVPSAAAAAGPNRVRRFTLSGMRDPHGLRPSAVDSYSRIVFPVAFIIFQIVYWCVLGFSSPQLPDGVTLLPRI